MNTAVRKTNTPILMSGHIRLPLYSTTTMNSKKSKDGLNMPKIFAAGGLLPYLPASQIKGALRRAAVQAILERQGTVLTTAEDYYFNMVGGVKGGKEAKPKDADGAAAPATEDAEGETETKVTGSALLQLRKYLPSNPVQQLFGSGELLGNFYPGHLYITNAIPEAADVAEYVTDGIRSDDARVRPDTMMATSSENILEEVEKMFEANKIRSELKSQIEVVNKDLRAAKKADNPEELARLTALKAELEKKRKEDKANPVSMPWSFSYASFSAPLPVRLTLSREASLVELGLLLAAMDWQMRNEPFYGGHKTLGFGEFSAEYACSGGNTAVLTPFAGAEISGTLFIEAMSTFEAAVSGFSLASPGKKPSKK